MNKFLAFFCFVSVYVCLAEAATSEEVQNVIKNASQQVRQERMFALKSAIRDSMISATTPQQRFCIKGQISKAVVGLNQALNAEQTAAENEYQTLSPQELEQLDIVKETEKLHERFANAAAPYSKEALISQCQ